MTGTFEWSGGYGLRTGLIQSPWNFPNVIQLSPPSGLTVPNALTLYRVRVQGRFTAVASRVSGTSQPVSQWWAGAHVGLYTYVTDQFEAADIDLGQNGPGTQDGDPRLVTNDVFVPTVWSTGNLPVSEMVSFSPLEPINSESRRTFDASDAGTVSLNLGVAYWDDFFYIGNTSNPAGIQYTIEGTFMVRALWRAR
jgi:hypothetical protein